VIADGSQIYAWAGAPPLIVVGVPPQARFLRAYKGRLYAAGDPDNPKRLYGSKIQDYTEWSVGAGAVVADAEQFDQEPITGLAVIGSSLLLPKQDAIQRFSGVTAEDFNLGRDSEGISRAVGCVAPGTVVEVENLVYMLTGLGPYVVAEGGTQPIGEQLADFWESANKELWGEAVACWNQTYKQYRLFLPAAGEQGNYTGWYYHQTTNSWTGPHVYRLSEQNAADQKLDPISVTAMARYELPTGEDLTMFGGEDGFVRLQDTVARDDVLADGSGGVAIPWDVEWPTMHFGVLADEKALDDLTLAMALPPGEQATAYWEPDGEGEEQATVDGVDDAVQNYDVGRLPSVGRRIRFGVRGVSLRSVQLVGFELMADVIRRR
jgi:hypothetical protein